MADCGFLIAATSSGCGKTTLSLGLMMALRQRSLSVQPFKCGPDYIDTQFHTKATGNPSINLDTFMSSEHHVKELFTRYGGDKDVAIVEGVMGMFDGFSKMQGSSAELSQILSLPVILVVNAASTAYSVAATIFGFKNFRKDVNIAGVIFNRVSSEKHFSFLKDACQDAGLECFGYIQKNEALTTPSRHLGLTLTAEEEMENFINSAANAVRDSVDIDKLLSLTKIDTSSDNMDKLIPIPTKIAAVAYDEAFSFVYTANIDQLRRSGYEIEYFSPIHDRRLPKADFVYIPGGYPELFLKEISGNKAMKKYIMEYIVRGGKLWAECGGLIYLTRNMDGYEMCGAFPLECTMEHSKLSLGYREIKFDNFILKGHEFHYSHIKNPDSIPSVADQYNAKGNRIATPVYRYKNALASYTHLYWGDKDIFKLWE
ncbi:MAG: cobyrinate a,c-diamide synthase [Lachnospiraceae bacterium]|nr:cobyrinate a,c-diamide synthase [Lachnospiraceae bacterium]